MLTACQTSWRRKTARLEAVTMAKNEEKEVEAEEEAVDGKSGF